MRRIWLALVALGWVGLANAGVVPVPEDEAVDWLDHLIPLPQEISIPRKATIRTRDVTIRLRPDASDVEQQAITELHALFQEKAGLVPAGDRFEILIGVVNEKGEVANTPVPNAERLKEFPHRGQAYLIQPRPGGDGDGLVVAALNPAGVYYGVQTLRQLLAPTITRDQVSIPLASVADWPDMDERGLWNNDLDLIPWLATMKLNFNKVQTSCQVVRRDEPVRATIPSTARLPNVLEAARLRAVHAVPIVTHLNYIGHHHQAYEAYPELAGVGDGAVPDCGAPSRNIRVPCGSSPILKRVIAEYMRDLARQGARDISVWLSEHQAQCQCEPCLEAGQFRTETRAAHEAWLEVREQDPGMVLRIFYCMGGKSFEDTFACLMALPPEVRIEWCYGRYGGAFDACAAKERWLASYAGPPLSPAQYSGMRFYGASRTRDYVDNLHSKKWSGVYSINYVYSTGAWQQALYGFHIGALAEWAWNLNGRSPAQYARAWATREGYARPAEFGEWIVLMDPIQRENLAALSSSLWTQTPEWIKTRQTVRLGQGLFSGFRTAESFEQRLAACRTALRIAEDLDRPELVLETRYNMEFVRSLKALNDLLAQASSGDVATRESPLNEFRQAATGMIRLMDDKTDLVAAEPRSFAETIKKDHAALWKNRLAAITSAALQTK